MALVHESISDSVLFPRDPLYHNMGSDDVTSGLNTSYDPYPSMSAYSAPPAYYNAPHYFFELAKSQDQHRFTPVGSPSPSISQALDQPPSTTLSSASGASVQSTASSAVGSPYSHATHNLPSQDQWTESHHGLGIASGVVHSNDGFGHDMAQWGGMENESIFDNSKFQDSFIGESENLSSSPISPSCPASLSISSCSAAQDFRSGYSLPHQTMASNPSGSGRNVTIDTILEEINSTITSSPPTASPISTSSTRISPATAPINHSPQGPRSFRSPTAPASAMSPSFPNASFASWTQRRLPRRQSVISGADLKCPRNSVSPTDRHNPYARPFPIPEPQAHFPSVHSPSPFFGQSSGRFIPPLQSSCWFSLLILLLLFFSLTFSLSFFFLIVLTQLRKLLLTVVSLQIHR